MTDALGYRKKFAVMVPSTNTTVQPEMDMMRPPGVTNHLTRIDIPNIPLNNDADFEELVRLIQAAQDDAVRRVMSCEPDYFVMGISAETFWDGLAASRELKASIEKATGLGVAMGSEACDAALKRKGARRIGVITPYQPVGDRNVVRFFEESGYEVVKIKGLKCASPVKIAHVQPAELIDAIHEVNVDGVEAIVQVGTNLSMVQVAAEAERWIRKPVIAINAAIYWFALRVNGINDRIPGLGSLLMEELPPEYHDQIRA